MATITKKHVVEAMTAETGLDRAIVKKIVQSLFTQMIAELERGNRIEFRDFGVFETRTRAPRRGQNPKTLERVEIAARRVVRFKEGRLMRDAINGHAETPAPAPHSGNNGQVIRVKKRRTKAATAGV